MKYFLRTSICGLLILILVLIQGPFASAKPHPLDPLSTAEINLALELLKKSDLVTPDTLFPYLMLNEPPKKEVLAFHEGEKFRREAFAELFDRKNSKLLEVVIDLRTQKIKSKKIIAGAQPSVMLSEFDAAPPIVKADPRFKEAMNRRGIKNLDDVQVDIWAYGSPDSEHSQKARLLRAITYFKGKGKNFYARPIDGLTFIVNMDEKKVEKVIDSEVYPVPPVASDLDVKSVGPQRQKLKPFVITQPEGPSYQVEGNEVTWQNWRFRYTMHPREGLVIYLVQYHDHGKWRPILYRGSLSDMMVPYGDPDQHWTYRSAFDEGEYGIGRYSGPLTKGAEVPENAELFDATFVDDFGKPYVTKNAVALYERDGGLLWKHFDMYAGGNYVRRSRELVISFITTISNYDYGLNWIFKQDGSLQLEAQLTGIMLAKGSNVKSMNGSHDHAHPDLAYGHLVAPNVVAPHHQHFFNFRLDLDVDGANNSVSELNTTAITDAKINPAGNAFLMQETQLKNELDAQRDLDAKAQRKWKIFNPKSVNSLGYQAGFILIPGENAAPYLQESSPLKTRGGFVNHQVWVTQERDDEVYAGGAYPTQRATSDGLPTWSKQNRSLDAKDLVLWYTFCVTHAPRPEEWPVMSVHRTGFQIVPAGFFEKNPALDVAPTTNSL